MVLFIWVHVCLVSSNFINWVCRWNPSVWNILAELLFKLSDSLRVEFSDGAYEIDDGDDEHDEDFDNYKSHVFVCKGKVVEEWWGTNDEEWISWILHKVKPSLLFQCKTFLWVSEKALEVT